MDFLIIKKNLKKSKEKPLIINISKKVSKKAVDRNLFKRRIRKIADPYIKESDQGLKVIAKPGADKLSFGDLKKEFLNQIDQ